MIVAIGIDVGYGRGRFTAGTSAFSVRGAPRRPTIEVLRATMPLSTEELHDYALRDGELGDPRVAVVALDAPLTPVRLANRPTRGRVIDARFSRGTFSNAKRGPQPGSIATPKQGWPLYEAGMDIAELLAARGHPYQHFPSDSSVSLTTPCTVEVIPKLTQALLAPRARLVERPRGSNIDEHLFAAMLASELPSTSSLERLLEPAVLAPSVFEEARRIQSLPTAARHEAIGAFIAGLQGALLLADASSFVGVPGQHEGYYVLPTRWHDDWAAAWRASAKESDAVRMLPGRVERVV